MDTFSYLSVLVSIILGLGITQLLTGLSRLLSARQDVRWYWPAVAWPLIMLLIHVQAWWGMFGLRTHTTWTFGGFLVVLLLPSLLYLAATLVTPDDRSGGTLDLRQRYYAHARWFFVLSIGVIVASFVRPLALGDTRHVDADAAMHLVFALMFATAAATSRPRYHEAVTALFAVLLVLYAFVLFGTLS